LEKVQEGCQEYQENIIRCEDSRNSKQEPNKHKLPAIEAIKYDSQPCLSPDSLWRALHSSFNTTLHHQVDVNVLNEIGSKVTSFWKLFSKEEFRQVINKCNNLLAPKPDKLT